jgi:hypothetical protein
VNRHFAGLILFILAATPLVAQPEERGAYRPFRSEVELQFFRFGNFFQASAGSADESVNGLGVEYRAAWRRTETAPDLYAHLNVLRYSGGASDTSYSGRVGVVHYGSVHSYNVYIDRMENGYAFDLEETAATANITSVSGYYLNRITPDWQVGANVYLERQRFDVQTGIENDYRSIGVQARYRGFGNLVQPRIGYVTGEREVDDPAGTYDEDYWYVQVGSEPHPQVNVSLRYRDRTRDYQNIDREDDRDQWLARAAYRQNDRLSWAASLALEDVSSTSGRDFDTTTFYLGLIYGF